MKANKSLASTMAFILVLQLLFTVCSNSLHFIYYMWWL